MMEKKTYSRKEFLSFFKTGRSEENDNAAKEVDELNSEKKEFLEKYTYWLKDFEGFVKSRKPNTFDVKQNKRLMELAAKIENDRKTLESYMRDPVFAREFEQLTKDISSSI
jgi:hypothetical protein